MTRLSSNKNALCFVLLSNNHSHNGQRERDDGNERIFKVTHQWAAGGFDAAAKVIYQKSAPGAKSAV